MILSECYFCYVDKQITAHVWWSNELKCGSVIVWLYIAATARGEKTPLDICSNLFSGVTSAGLINFNSYSMLHSLYLDLILCCIHCILIFHVYPVHHFLPPQGPPVQSFFNQAGHYPSALPLLPLQVGLEWSLSVPTFWGLSDLTYASLFWRVWHELGCYSTSSCETF